MAPLKLPDRSIDVQAEALTRPASLKSNDYYCLLLKIKELIENEKWKKHLQIKKQI